MDYKRFVWAIYGTQCNRIIIIIFCSVDHNYDPRNNVKLFTAMKGSLQMIASVITEEVYNIEVLLSSILIDIWKSPGRWIPLIIFNVNPRERTVRRTMQYQLISRLCKQITWNSTWRLPYFHITYGSVLISNWLRTWFQYNSPIYFLPIRVITKQE